MIRKYLAMMPRITADESMLASTRIAIGSGSAAPEDAKRVRDHWDKASENPRSGARRPHVPPAAAGPSPGLLARYRIGIRKVTKKPRTHEDSTHV